MLNQLFMRPRVGSGVVWSRLAAVCMAAGALATAAGLGWNFSESSSAAQVGVPTAKASVDFVKDVAPILDDNCAACHARGRSKGHFQLDTREHLLKGGEGGGDDVMPGHSEQSRLIDLVNETDPEMAMPKKGRHLSPADIATLRAWIDQGAAWPAGVMVGTFKQAALEPRRPKVPGAAPGSGLSNPIDLLLQPYFAANGVKLGAAVDDRTYARRVYMDVIGLLPEPEELEAFVADKATDKRPRLVEKLLGDHRRYAEHWMSFWNDLLRNDYQGTGYIDGGRQQITQWLFGALESNLPYDEFVRQLITGANGAEGFTKGIVWRGVVNSSQMPQMQASQNISQVMMGINMKCASCHDSFISNWKLTDSYGLAGVYADHPLELERCGVAQGKTAPIKFLYPQLGTIDQNAPRGIRIKQLATVITDGRNGRLTRTIVNRLWQKCMGRGLVEPTDEMDNPAWDADVLDELAVELADHGYDLKQTLTTILTSRAYQMPAVGQAGESDEHFVFRGPVVRRMTAEQFVDAVSTVTGVWAGKAKTKLDGEAVRQPRAVVCPADPLTTALGRPNREQVVTERASAATTLQGLELTNGSTMAEVLHQGGAKYVGDKSATPEELIRRLYARALGRAPTASELQTALRVVGMPAKTEGVEDLMWAVFMLPEFQLIR
jgi:mono/diheme cytochrome c family protein